MHDLTKAAPVVLEHGALAQFFAAITPYDEQGLRVIHALAPDFLTPLSKGLAYLGGAPVLTVICMILLAILWKKCSKNTLLFTFYALIGSIALNWTVKSFFHRVRPELWHHATAVYGTSFPSGHSQYAAALGATIYILARHTRWAYGALRFAILWTLGLGLSRLVLAVHYPSDVMGGWILGWVWVWFCAWCLGLLTKARPSMRPT